MKNEKNICQICEKNIEIMKKKKIRKFFSQIGKKIKRQ